MFNKKKSMYDAYILNAFIECANDVNQWDSNFYCKSTNEVMEKKSYFLAMNSDGW
jgi:hypothetical protein